MFEQINTNSDAGQKRSAPRESNKKSPQFRGNNGKNIRCFKCNQVGHKSFEYKDNQSNLNTMQCYFWKEEGQVLAVFIIDNKVESSNVFHFTFRPLD